MKLLIVDDEQIEREGMEAILKKAFPEVIIKQAKNGYESIQIAKSFHPDLVLMDIKMPGISGLEAIEKLLQDFPEMKFILVTAYDTFDFARQAIRLGVKDYLLKPSKAREITETVGNVLLEIKEEKQKKEEAKRERETLEKTLALAETDIVTQLLFDHVHEVHIDYLVEMLGMKPSNELFVMTVLVNKQDIHIYKEIKENIRTEGLGWVGPYNGNQIPIIAFRDKKHSFRFQAVALAKKILEIASFHKQNWIIGIGRVCRTLSDVRKSYRESLLAFVGSKPNVKYQFYSDVHLLKDSYTRTILKKLEKELQKQLHKGDIHPFRERIMELIQHYEMEGKSCLEAQQGVLEILWVISSTMNEMGLNIDTPRFSFQTENYRQLRTETGVLLDQLIQAFKEYFKQMEADTIQKLQKYIEEHSHENISLEILSERVGLSPIYISRIFKERLGVNYIDFLTECRIEKAKKLLRDPDKSIKEIAIDVGYHEPNYFSKVFKKVTSQSPKEYRHSFFHKVMDRDKVTEKRRNDDEVFV